jgi:hypothetical protein
MSDRHPGDPRREPQILTEDELIVYEAIAILRGPVDTGELTAKTGLKDDTVRAALDRLAGLEMVEIGDRGVRIGPNDWDVRGAE